MTINQFLTPSEIEIYKARGFEGLRKYIQERKQEYDKNNLFREIHEALGDERTLDPTYIKDLRGRIDAEYKDRMRFAHIAAYLDESEREVA